MSQVVTTRQKSQSFKSQFCDMHKWIKKLWQPKVAIASWRSTKNDHKTEYHEYVLSCPIFHGNGGIQPSTMLGGGARLWGGWK